MKRIAVAVLIVAGIALSGCTKVAPFACSADDQCAPGRCEATGACSFADTSCHADRRYATGSTPDVAGRCVGSESGPLAQVADGSEHACARGADGRLWCWGDDKYGGLGRPGDSVDEPVPVDGVDQIIGLDGGEFHTCALAKGGQVWCWGADAQGELGRGSATEDPVPDPAPVLDLANVTQIDLGQYHSCALVGDGTVWCWGRNKDEEIGQDNASYQWTPVQVQVPSATSIAAGGQEGCAITTAGAVWCWGKNDSGQLGVAGTGRTPPTEVPAFAGATQIAVGAEHACALFGDGHVTCTGDDSHGQLGDGTTTGTHTPVTVSDLTDAVELAALDFATCARRMDGSVVCWGEDDLGELGDGGGADHGTPGAPLALGQAPAAQLTGGEGFACALTTDGCLWCWGDDSAGEIGDGPGSPGGVRPVLLGACTEPPSQ